MDAHDAAAETLLSDLQSYFGVSAPTLADSRTKTEVLPPVASDGLATNFRTEMRRRQRANSGSTSPRCDQSPMVMEGARPSSPPPTFSTSTHDLADGFWECDLHDEESNAVGRISFIDRSPTEAAAAISRFLGASVRQRPVDLSSRSYTPLC